MAKEECSIFSFLILKLNFGTFYRCRLKDVLFIENKQDIKLKRASGVDFVLRVTCYSSTIGRYGKLIPHGVTRNKKPSRSFTAVSSRLLNVSVGVRYLSRAML